MSDQVNKMPGLSNHLPCGSLFGPRATSAGKLRKVNPPNLCSGEKDSGFGE